MRKVKSELVEKGYDDKLKIGFCPFKEVHEHYGEYDVVMACPHFFLHFPAPKVARTQILY